VRTVAKAVFGWGELASFRGRPWLMTEVWGCRTSTLCKSAACLHKRCTTRLHELFASVQPRRVQ